MKGTTVATIRILPDSHTTYLTVLNIAEKGGIELWIKYYNVQIVGATDSMQR